MNALEPFENQKYLNLETFRRNGDGVQTPVWFVRDGSRLFVRTVADSGKVKRARRTGAVKLAPCKVDGTLIGAWAAASAREVNDPITAKKVSQLLDQKYGLMKKLFELRAVFSRKPYTVLELTLVEEAI